MHIIAQAGRLAWSGAQWHPGAKPILRAMSPNTPLRSDPTLSFNTLQAASW